MNKCAPPELIGVIDVGKTNAKLLLVEAETGELTWCVERPVAAVSQSAILELDVAGIERWLLSVLSDAPEKRRIRALVPVAHGAAAVLVSAAGKVLAAPDYEDPAFELVSEPYRSERESFDVTFSPFLPLGLNLGRQIYYFKQRHPDLMRSCGAILLYPQYWAWRLSDFMASEITSLGCHSDLWRPREARFSSLAQRLGAQALLPPMRAAGDCIGNLSRSVSEITGLDPLCRVHCGIHDSNASYLCHRVSRPSEEQFAVVSSGTWTVIMAHGADLSRLREDRDMLANVDAGGVPVPTARFMGGRDYEAIAGAAPPSPSPPLESLRCVIQARAMALPKPAKSADQFTSGVGEVANAEGLTDLERGALATLYCALQTDLQLDLLGASSTTIVDGPLARNPLYAALLAAFRPHARVMAGDNRAGSAQCARLLCGRPVSLHLTEVSPLDEPALASYRSQWRMRLERCQAPQ